MTCLLIEDHGKVRVLTMNRPEKHNALNTELTTRLLEALQDADRDADVHALVLTGNGKSFCAGPTHPSSAHSCPRMRRRWISALTSP